MVELCFYSPSNSKPSKLIGTGKMSDCPSSIFRFIQVTLHQGRIESALLKKIGENSGIQVERGVVLMELDVDERSLEREKLFPVRVKLRHLTEEEAKPA